MQAPNAMVEARFRRRYLTIVQSRRAVSLYLSGMSQRQVGKIIGCSHRAVGKHLVRQGVESRGYTSARVCVVCGAEVEKIISRGHYIGAKCRVHRLERKRQIMREVRANAKRRGNSDSSHRDSAAG